MNEPNNNIETFDVNPSSQENKEKNGKCTYFPSAFTIVICLQFIVFILTYIVPKGKFDTLEYDSINGEFIINNYTSTDKPKIEIKPGNEETLKEFKINIPLNRFKNGDIKKPISIPNSYTRLDDVGNANFFDLFTYPIYGMIDSANIAFVLMMIGGCINILVETKALTAGMEALGRITKGREILLMITAFFLVSIGGTTFGLAEEILSFYPVLMPIFVKSGLDGALGGASLYFGSAIGTMFSTVNPFAAGIASYSAGINFTEGIVLRVIGFILGDALTIGYFLFYNKRVKNNPEKSAVYDIRDEIIEKFAKDKNEEEVENDFNINDEEIPLKELPEINHSQFTLIQKISLILFGLSFVLLIIGVSALHWWLEQIAAIFLFLGIILMFLAGKGETLGIKYFTKGAGDFSSIIIIIGLARGINITLEKGLISDTILNALTNAVNGLPKVLFALILFIVFIILGLFIQSSSGLAVLSMPVFAPLAEEVHCSRAVVVDAYLFGQNFISFLTPTGLVLIVLQLVGMKYTHWFKFVWMYIIVLFIFLIIMIIISSLVN